MTTPHSAPHPTVTRPGVVPTPGLPTGIRPDLLAEARRSDWETLGLEYRRHLEAVMGSVEFALWHAPLALDELRPEAACHRMFQKICDLEEERDG